MKRITIILTVPDRALQGNTNEEFLEVINTELAPDLLRTFEDSTCEAKIENLP
jgi:hypothetical protein